MSQSATFLYVGLIIFHPILVSIVAFTALAVFLARTGLWARYKYRILLALLAAWAVDAAFALPRIMFAYGLSKNPVIAQQIPLPRHLVLIGDVRCEAKCHDWLISGAIDEIISVTPRQPRYADVTTAVRYRAGWTLPGACPRERERAINNPSVTQRQSGYCPLVEPAEIPKQGIFLVHEATTVTAKQSARAFTPTNLVKAPPGPLISYTGMEVQKRTPQGIAVLASTYRYEAPGLLGLPPLLGCWDRPDNVVWIMPPGDTGCGLWRWFTWGGDNNLPNNRNWIFEAFGPPDHQIVPPERAELPPPTPAQALEILSKVLTTDLDYHLPRLRNALLDPSVSDQALVDLIVSRGRRFNSLEGSLVALVGASRPASLAGLSGRLERMPGVFAKSGAVLDEMERNADFRDDFAGTMFLALQSRWETRENAFLALQSRSEIQENAGRFLKLMEASHPGWLCDQLSRVKGSAVMSKILNNYPEVKRSSTQCAL